MSSSSNFGKTIHFTYGDGHTYAGRVFPAIVTREHDGEDGVGRKYVDLCVFSATPHALHEVAIGDYPQRGAAHLAQLAGGGWSTTRYVDENGRAYDKLPHIVFKRGDNDDTQEAEPWHIGQGKVDALVDEVNRQEDGSQPAAEQPVADTSATDTDVIVPVPTETCTYCGKEYPAPINLNHSEAECRVAGGGGAPADNEPVSATRDDSTPSALEDISAGRPDSGNDEGGPI